MKPLLRLLLGFCLLLLLGAGQVSLTDRGFLGSHLQGASVRGRLLAVVLAGAMAGAGVRGRLLAGVLAGVLAGGE